MSLAKEFRDFAMRGNVIDLAVGIIIGGAFGKIVSSMVDDMIMPPVGKLLSGVDFKELFIALDGKTYANLKAAKVEFRPVHQCRDPVRDRGFLRVPHHQSHEHPEKAHGKPAPSRAARPSRADYARKIAC